MYNIGSVLGEWGVEINKIILENNKCKMFIYVYIYLKIYIDIW